MILAYIRTMVLYFLLILSVRLMGKRQVGQLETSEFVVAMLIADLAAVPMQDSAIPLLWGIVPLLTVLALELTVSFLAMKSIPVRRWLFGQPVILVENGKLLRENLVRTRICLEELTGRLRQKGVLSLEEVQHAILETDGTLSVFPWPQGQEKPRSLPVTLISDGRLCPEGLARAGRDRAWVQHALDSRHTRQGDTLLLSVDGEGHVVWIGKWER